MKGERNTRLCIQSPGLSQIQGRFKRTLQCSWSGMIALIMTLFQVPIENQACSQLRTKESTLRRGRKYSEADNNVSR